MSVSDKAVFEEILELVKFPYPTVCVHYVGARLLNMLEESGYPITSELAMAVVCAKDEEAIRALEGEIGKCDAKHR